MKTITYILLALVLITPTVFANEQEEYRYLVYELSGEYHAKSGITSEIDYSGLNKYDVIQYSINATSNGLIYCNNIHIEQSNLIMKEHVSIVNFNEGVLNMMGHFGHIGGQPYGFTSDHPAIRLHAYQNCSKPIIEWMDKDGNPIAYIVAHEKLYEDEIYKTHQHLSLETVESDMSTVRTRFAMTYGVDWSEIKVCNGHFVLGDETQMFINRDENQVSKLYFDDIKNKTIMTTPRNMAFKSNSNNDEHFEFYDNNLNSRKSDILLNIYGAGTGDQYLMLGYQNKYPRIKAGTGDMYIYSNKSGDSTFRFFTGGNSHRTAEYDSGINVYGSGGSDYLRLKNNGHESEIISIGGNLNLNTYGHEIVIKDAVNVDDLRLKISTPNNPKVGSLYFNTTYNCTHCYTGSKWVYCGNGTEV